MFDPRDHDKETATTVLDRVRERRAAADRAEADLLALALALACDWADLHPADSIDAAAVLIRGGDTALAVAGEGAPLVAEFAVAEYAAASRVPTRVGQSGSDSRSSCGTAFLACGRG